MFIKKKKNQGSYSWVRHISNSCHGIYIWKRKKKSTKRGGASGLLMRAFSGWCFGFKELLLHQILEMDEILKNLSNVYIMLWTNCGYAMIFMKMIWEVSVPPFFLFLFWFLKGMFFIFILVRFYLLVWLFLSCCFFLVFFLFGFWSLGYKSLHLHFGCYWVVPLFSLKQLNPIRLLMHF